MAIRIIPPPPASGRRARTTHVTRDLITAAYGAAHTYGPCPLTTPPNLQISTGGRWMVALLGPDLGDGLRRGTPTNANSLQPVMGLLNANSNKEWKAGHLLNADLGGSGTWDANLTPLTAGANSVHRAFEGHIKRMLELCDRIDQANPNYDAWYGVHYAVTVSPLRYADVPDPADMHSYAYSHLILNYRFVRLPKFPLHGPLPHTAPAPPNGYVDVSLVPPVDPRLPNLLGVAPPAFTPGPNTANWVVTNGIEFSVEIHNEL